MKRLIKISIIIIGTTAATLHKDPEGPDCNNSYLWFKVANMVESCSQVNLGDLEFIPDYINDGWPFEVPLVPGYASPYGCESFQSWACAVGYSIDQIERVYNGFYYEWRPRQTQVQNYRCCVTRNLTK